MNKVIFSGRRAVMSGVNGYTPTYWQSPSSISAWTAAGFSYSSSGSGGTCSSYTGGTTFNAAVAFNSGSTGSMRATLCSSLTLTNSIWIAALLNSVAVPNYVLTKQQVLDMYNGILAPPSAYPNTTAGKIAFLKTTW